MADIKNVCGILWEDIVAIAGASAASVISMSGAPAPPPIQTATLSATKYGLYTAISTTSWTLAVNAASSTANATSSLAINSQVSPTRTGTINANTRINLQFDLSSYSTSSILNAKLTLDVGGITTTATPNEVFVLDLGNTFDFPTLNNANYSLYIQSGSFTEYATDTISTTGLYELGFSAAAITTANTYPSAYSMALLTYFDRNDIAPNINDQYLLAFNSTPELIIAFI
jgi:hypothetical protein